jgi:hypothetical protein
VVSLPRRTIRSTTRRNVASQSAVEATWRGWVRMTAQAGRAEGADCGRGGNPRRAGCRAR